MGEMKRLKLFAILLIILSTLTKAQTTVNDGWMLLSEGKFSEANKIFQEATKTNEKLRALLALAYSHEANSNPEAAWKYYKEALAETPDWGNYLLATKTANRYVYNMNKSNAGVGELWAKLAESGVDGGMQVQAISGYARYLEGQNQVAKAIEIYKKEQAVLQWSVIGPFENLAASGFDEVYFPEKEFKKNIKSVGKSNIPVEWFDITKVRIDNWIDFESYFAHTNSMYYANTFVYSQTEQNVQMRIGTSGAFKLFLNDATVLSCAKERNNDLDTYIGRVTLMKGWNRILVKCGYSEIGACNFLLRITDEKGTPINGLEYSTSEQPYTKAAAKPIAEVGSPFEMFFKNKIAANPNDIENYLLLSDLYLANDKTVDAEITLRKAAELYPDNMVIMYKQCELFGRAGKYTEMLSTHSRMEEISPESIYVLFVNFQLQIQNRNPEYENTIGKLIELLYPGQVRDLLRVSYYGMKNQPKEMIALLDSMYTNYPESWEVVGQKKKVDFYVNKSHENSAEILERYLEKRSSADVMLELTDTYVNLNKIDKYEKTFANLLELYPAGSGYLYRMASQYIQWQDYKKAQVCIKKALEIAPGCSAYHELLGDILKAEGDLEQCKAAYTVALDYNQTNYNLRKKLQDVLPKDVIDTEVVTYDIKKLIAEADTSTKYAGEDAVILLDDFKRKFYSGGASESESVMLVKVLTNNGIKEWNEYTAQYYSANQDFIFEKAVVIKKDGSEIPADNDNGHFVFKSLEQNDYILMKYKIRNRFQGSLSEHFWDEIRFDQFYPVSKARYVLITPAKQQFHFAGQNFDGKPKVDKTVDNRRILVWEMQDLPAIKGEMQMPSYTDVAKSLYTSTIKDWNYLSKWYYNLSRSRLEDSYEITELVWELFDSTKQYTDMEKAHIIQDYIISVISYSSVSFRQSGFVPQKAREVLVTKMGDCKDMATLFIAMAKVVGLPANYVLLNTADQGKYAQALPGLYFNHAIVSVPINGKNYLIDLTANYHAFLSLPSQDLGANSLLITAKGEDRTFTPERSYLPSNVRRKITASCSADNSMEITYTNTFFGERAAFCRMTYFDKDSVAMIKEISEAFADVFTNFKALDMTLTPNDTITNMIQSEYAFSVTNYLVNTGAYKILRMPWPDIVEAGSAISYEKRNYAIIPGDFTDTNEVELEVKLPAGYTVLETPAAASYTYNGDSYKLSFKLEGDRLFVQRRIISSHTEVPPAAYEEYKKFRNSMVEADNTQILLKKQK